MFKAKIWSDVIRQLMEAGASAYQPSNNGDTPIHDAAREAIKLSLPLPTPIYNHMSLTFTISYKYCTN